MMFMELRGSLLRLDEHAAEYISGEKTLVRLLIVTRVVRVGGLFAKINYTSPPTKRDGQLNVICIPTFSRHLF